MMKGQTYSFSYLGELCSSQRVSIEKANVTFQRLEKAKGRLVHRKQRHKEGPAAGEGAGSPTPALKNTHAQRQSRHRLGFCLAEIQQQQQQQTQTTLELGLTDLGQVQKSPDHGNHCHSVWEGEGAPRSVKPWGASFPESIFNHV